MISVTTDGELLEVPEVVAHAGHWAGDGLFETLRADDRNGAWFVDRHHARMAQAAERLGLEMPQPGIVRRATQRALSSIALGDAVVRWFLVATDREGHTRLLVDAAPFEVLPDAWYAVGVRLGESDIPHPGLGALGKSLSWGWARAAERQARRKGEDDAVICRDGVVVETSRATLVVQKDGEWYTPPSELGGLSSITQAVLRDAGWSFKDSRFGLAELATADAVICLSSLRLAVAARSVCGSPIPVASAAAAEMRDAVVRAVGA